ncbi:hypothetical protein [Hyphomicrobium nitrativorans]|uniref:hypothetical protein n=1 Tax=Hyphomicrobium nitrativorans TaxID=1427356 RepID=UPI001182ED1E|nr:hypothetical protein [Hyphomicrobium nitrativorans]
MLRLQERRVVGWDGYIFLNVIKFGNHKASGIDSLKRDPKLNVRKLTFDGFHPVDFPFEEVKNG